MVGNYTINTNSDTEIQVSEATAFSGTISCYNLSISDLTGIEAFTSLSELFCNTNSLTSLDVTQNTALLKLRCDNNSLTSLDVTQNWLLNELHCKHNSLTSLDVTQNSLLTKLDCNHNSLTNLDASVKSYLTNLSCDFNPLTSLNINYTSNLTDLNCNATSLTSLDVSQNIALINLFCGWTPLTSLNVANGNNTNITNFVALSTPSLSCIQVDDVAYSTTNWTNIDAAASFSLNCSVGINELNTENISIYPNPATTQITVETEEQIKNISIFDITGKTVKIVDENTNTINVSDLTNGIYFLQIQTDKGLVSKKFIKE